MSKRAAEDLDNGSAALKGGERPEAADLDLEGVGEFEDEFEDEYESEDEIIEAGVDGRPDAEREAEERAGKWNSCNYSYLHKDFLTLL
jgi:ribosome assembly protein RRB1